MRYQRLVIQEAGTCRAQEGELDSSLEPGEVLIRNRLSLVGDGDEGNAFTGSLPGRMGATQPYEPGEAAVGEVIESHAALPKGARVFHAGGHATHRKAAADQVSLIPEGISDERAVFLSVLTRALTPHRLAPLRIGEQVLVAGLSLSGNLCAQLYAQAGAGRVACADRQGARLGKARACGLIEGYDLNRQPLVKWAEGLGQRGAELVVVADGGGAYLAEALEAAAAGGMVLLLARPARAENQQALMVAAYEKGLAVIGCNPERQDWQARAADRALMIEWLRWEKLKVDPLITHRMHFSEALQAYEGQRDYAGDFLGILLYY